MKEQTAILMSILLVVGALGGYWYVSNDTAQQALPISPGGEVGTTTFSVCGDTNLGTPSYCSHNQYNTSYHCLPQSARIYQINSDGSYSLIATQTLTESASASTASTTLPCKDGTGSNIKYRVWMIATENSGASIAGYISGYKDFDFTTSAKPQIVFEGAKQQEIVLRIYEDTEKAYLPGTSGSLDMSGSASGTDFHPQGNSFNSTSTSGSTAIGTDGELNYILHFKVHPTNSTVAKADDGNVYWAVDIQSSADWDNAVTNMGTLPRVTNVPTKISNLNYDIVFDGNSLKPIRGTEKTVPFYTKALSGINPDDDVVLGYFTEGYYVSTSSSNVGLGVSADDSSKTLVYSEQKWTVVVD